MRLVFFGTPDIAIPTLQALLANREHELLAAVTQPDRPSGRGHKLQAPPVKLLCQQYNIPVFQPEKLSKAPEIIEALRQLEPDLIIMVAFGQILKKDVLNIPKYGVINLHASLLPAYRGAAPINWSIINGETVTGITTMFTEAGLDTGPILLSEKISLDDNINSQELTDIMAQCGAKLVIQTLEQLSSGILKAQPQNENEATYAPILNKSMGKIDWSANALKIHNLVRGLIPWPLAFANFRGNPLKIWRTDLLNADKLVNLQAQCVEVGTVVSLDKAFFVSCGNNTWLELKEVQPLNKSRMRVADWSNGIHLQPDEKFEP